MPLVTADGVAHDSCIANSCFDQISAAWDPRSGLVHRQKPIDLLPNCISGRAVKPILQGPAREIVCDGGNRDDWLAGVQR